jgi:hypothetical protein
MLTHTFYTWFLANLLHPVLFLLLDIIAGNGSFFRDAISIGLIILMVSFVVSIPCLIVSFVFVDLLVKTPLSGYTKFGVWLLAGVFMTLVELLIILPSGETVLRSLPAIISAGLSILIRYPQFIKLTCNS